MNDKQKLEKAIEALIYYDNIEKQLRANFFYRKTIEKKLGKTNKAEEILALIK